MPSKEAGTKSTKSEEAFFYEHALQVLACVDRDSYDIPTVDDLTSVGETESSRSTCRNQVAEKPSPSVATSTTVSSISHMSPGLYPLAPSDLLKLAKEQGRRAKQEQTKKPSYRDLLDATAFTPRKTGDEPVIEWATPNDSSDVSTLSSLGGFANERHSAPPRLRRMSKAATQLQAHFEELDKKFEELLEEGSTMSRLERLRLKVQHECGKVDYVHSQRKLSMKGGLELEGTEEEEETAIERLRRKMRVECLRMDSMGLHDL